jgi:[glutamine synthetase] adenylyltransferase / [glutamine synthetase]-adenylyl-L-tyrosine phosphorylase
MRPEDLLLAPELSTEKTNQFLKGYGFKDPEAADRNLQLIAEELPIRHILARMVKGLLDAARQSPDPDAALNYFERLFSNVAHRANFLGFLAETPEALEALILICGTTPFGAEILIRNPEYFYWLLDQIGTPWTKSAELYWQEARQATKKFEDATQKLHALARFKRRELLRIGSRDILKVTGVIGTTAELSNLADAILQSVYEVCHGALLERHGVPRYEDEQGRRRDARFSILAMGKLGARELNYSSDVDLIYVYDGEQGATESVLPLATSIANRDFFAKLAQSITHELSRLTEEGYFYRVDLRLRPEGSAGPVASSLSACRNYYASWGETFERLALIKARPAGGSLELGQQFCEMLRPFVYRKFLDFAALEEIQEIKTRIEAKLSSRKSSGHHVKLGAGGIREVEFFVQALQLIYGGSHPELQERGTVQALEKLSKLGFLEPQEHRELLEAYLFLRDLEHKLQMVYHFQTHELPTAPEELYKCARRMGFKAKTHAATVDQFLATFQMHRTVVQQHFQNLISLRRDGSMSKQMREAALILNKNLSEAEALEILSKPGFDDLRTALHQIVLLRDAPSFAHSPSRMRNLLANLMPSLLDTLRLSPDPDTGLSYFERFASALGARDALYTILNESPPALHRLIRVLSSSQFLADLLCRKSELLDSVLRDEYLEQVKSRDTYLSQFRRAFQKASTFEARRVALRELHHEEMFLIQVRDILDVADRPSVGAQLAALAEASLLAAFELACLQLEEKEGSAFALWAQQHFVMLALGKLGGNDLSYNSDLDIVYFYSVGESEQANEVQPRASLIAETMDEILSISRGEGTIYKIDTRLRPEGKKGSLVAAIHKLKEYLETRAQPWERLAMVRHRFVQGSPSNCAYLEQLLGRFVYDAELSAATIQDIVHVRRRMESELGKESEAHQFHIKAGCGGLIDIEFAVQLLQIKHGKQRAELRVPNTVAALTQLQRDGIVSRPDFQVLYLGYEFLRFLENRLSIASPYGIASVSRSAKNLGRVARLTGYSIISEPRIAAGFERVYLDITRQVRRVFDRILSNLPQGQ